MPKVIQRNYKSMIFFHFKKCTIEPEPHSVVQTVNYDNKDYPNSCHFFRIGAWGHQNWLPREADRTAIRFLRGRQLREETEQPWSCQQMITEPEPGATALTSDTKLSLTQCVHSWAPHWAISEVAEITLIIIIRATQLPWEEQESPLFCLWAYLWLTTTLGWPRFHRSEDQSWSLHSHKWISSYSLLISCGILTSILHITTAYISTRWSSFSNRFLILHT